MTDSDSSVPTSGRRWGGACVALAGLGLAVLVAALLVLAAFGSRWGWWEFRDAFAAMRWIVYGGLGALAIATVGAVLAVRRRSLLGVVAGLAGLALAAAAVWIPYQNRVELRESPRLSDITTDMLNPPAFVAIVELRRQANARNPVEYGADKAALQRRYYPDLAPVIVNLPPAEAFDRALAVVRDLGWTMVAADKDAGRIEAYDTTFWFGFVDDVVIRVARAEQGTRVDIRSSSRIGRREAGMNAKRVRAFLAAMRGG
ncbi:MAG TPA: DUF1499 domain-containing protein [Alphaproteobacteria bacterium]